MCSVYKRKFLPEIILCYRLIGDQHEILDDLGGNIPLVWFDFNRSALLIQNNLGLREIKIDRAAAHPLFAQDRCQFLHPLKHRNELFVFPDLCLILIL